MSYKPFGKIKNIVFPLPTSAMTIKAYKEAYGIDLMEYIHLDDVNKVIVFTPADNVCIYLAVKDAFKSYESWYSSLGIIPVVKFSHEMAWNPDDSESAMTSLGNGEYVLLFSIAHNKDFTLDNLEISAYEN